MFAWTFPQILTWLAPLTVAAVPDLEVKKLNTCSPTAEEMILVIEVPVPSVLLVLENGVSWLTPAKTEATAMVFPWAAVKVIKTFVVPVVGPTNDQSSDSVAVPVPLPSRHRLTSAIFCAPYFMLLMLFTLLGSQETATSSSALPAALTETLVIVSVAAPPDDKILLAVCVIAPLPPPEPMSTLV